MPKPSSAAWLGLLALATAAHAAVPGAAVDVRRVEKPPVIDGVLDDDAWRDATPVSGFWKMRPVDNEAASESTQVWFAEDTQNLYIAFHARDSRPDAVRCALSGHDQCMNDDIVGVLLDTFHDHRRAYELFVNGLGVQADAVAAEASDDDFSIDLVWQSAGRRTADGYAVEMAIPFRSLRYPGTSVQTWGVAMVRQVLHATEQDAWPRIDRENNCILCQTADLTNVRPAGVGRVVEVLPSVTGLRRGAQNAALSRFAYDPVKYEAGVGLKVGITPSLVADATANPDFSQVESDVAQVTVNQRFALFYPEKRPFFLEGQDLFANPLQLIHTRTIYDPVGAVKFTGKQGGTTIAALSAIDDQPFVPDGDVLPATGLPDRDAAFNILRLKQEVGARTTLGVIATDRELGVSHNRVESLDGVGRLGQHWNWVLQGVTSDTRNLDGTQHAGTGAAGDVSMQGTHLDLDFGYLDLSPGFRADAGYVPRVDVRDGSATVGWQQKPNAATLKRWRGSVQWRQLYNHDGFLELQQIRPRIQFDLARQTTVVFRVMPWRERFAGRTFAGTKPAMSIDCQPWKRVSWNMYLEEGDDVHYDEADPFRARAREVDLGLTLHASANLAAELSGTKVSEWHSGGGSQTFDVTLGRAKVTYQFDRALALRAIGQWQAVTETGVDRRLDLDLLASYTPYPGTVFYVGYDDGYGDPAGDLTRTFHRQDRALFFKASYLWRR